jgi:hypothetical protein
VKQTLERAEEPLPLPKGRLAHLCDGRARLSFRERSGDSDFFGALERSLADVTGITEVVARPATGSMIIAFEGDPAAFIANIARAGLFEIVPQEPAPQLRDLLRKQAREFESDLKQATDGAIDLPALAFLFFASVGVVQLARGRVGLSALSAFWYAASQFSDARTGSQASREQRPSGAGEQS